MNDTDLVARLRTLASGAPPLPNTLSVAADRLAILSNQARSESAIRAATNSSERRSYLEGFIAGALFSDTHDGEQVRAIVEQVQQTLDTLVEP